MAWKKRMLRRSHAISPFGVGAMCNFPNNEVLIAAALSKWPHQKRTDSKAAGLELRDQRLEGRLGVTHFRLPPAETTEGEDSDNRAYLPFVRFPRWHYCPSCGMMRWLPHNSRDIPRCEAPDGSTCKKIHERRRPRLIPSRFVGTCSLGHLQDFPYIEWVHAGKPDCNSPQLQLISSKSAATVTGALIKCVSCGSTNALMSALGGAQAQQHSALLKCKGETPWDGGAGGGPGCTQQLKILPRGASNVYFPSVVSSIYIPSANSGAGMDPLSIKIREELIGNEDYWSRVITEDKTAIDKAKLAMWCSFVGIADSDIEKVVKIAEGHLASLSDDSHANETPLTEEQYRAFEHHALCAGISRRDDNTNETLNLTKADIARDYKDIVASNFSEVILANKIRETRALVGFVRVSPPLSLSEGRVQRIKHNKNQPWLPAVAAYGEGIFLQLDPEKIDRWANNPAVIERIQKLSARYNTARIDQNPKAETRPINPRFILIHTLSHLLINQLVFDCGYGSSSLRERIYCNLHDGSPVMNATLIYTSSGDSEGTLGGLVRQGRPGNLENVLFRAIEGAKWCSSDPICMEMEAQGPDGANLAACHSCCLLPETSCEEGNRLLDRAMLIGTIEDPSIGFFTFET